jgi:hypothetical protein
MYILTFVHRAHSSGYESIGTKSFDTLEAVSKYIQTEWYDEQFEDWDEEDMGCKQPSRDSFTSKELEMKLGKKGQVELYGPYSQFCALVPDQMILTSQHK